MIVITWNIPVVGILSYGSLEMTVKQIALFLLAGVLLTSCTSNDVARRITPSPNGISIQSQERHGRCDYYLTTIEFLYQISDQRDAPSGSIYAFANYSVRGNDANNKRATKETFVIVTDGGTRYQADPDATAQFQGKYLPSSVEYDGLPYYTSENLPYGRWRDHFALFLIPIDALKKHPKLEYDGDKA
jgi:hypothetical protein